MKFKKVLLSICAVLIFITPALAFDPGTYSDYSAVYTADQTSIVAGAGYFYGIVAMTDGTNACTIKTYDNTANSGSNKLHPDWVVTTSSSDRVQFFAPPWPVAFNTGISVDITCSGTCSYQVFYRKK